MEAKYSIGAFSKKTGTSIRALRYYDEIGLLKPTLITESGRRYYSDDEFITLQKIISLKFLGYSLEEINEFLYEKDWNLKDSLTFLKTEMIQKKLHLECVIRALDHALYMAEDHEEIDSSIFISLIQNIQMENEHKEWLKKYISDEKIDELYNVPEEKMLELNKKSLQIIAKLKQAFEEGEVTESRDVQTLIHDYIEIAREVAGGNLEMILEELSASVEDIENNPALFYYPLSPEEEQWVGKAMEIYMKKNGLIVDE